MDINKKKYISIFLITLGIFASVFLVVNSINKSKNENIADLQRKITIDLIANETQFDLLKNAPCKAIEGESVLSRQMNELGKKLVHAEETQGETNKHVLELKKYYSLLEVKDYLLSQEVANKCDIQIESIIYFYENNCADCEKQGYVLTELKRKYPWLRIYSFDKNLDFSIVKTFSGLYELDDKTPIVVIDGETYSGFRTVEEIEEYIPALREKKEMENLKKKSLEVVTSDSSFENIDVKFVSYDDGVVIYSYLENETNVKKEIELKYDDEKEEFSIINDLDNSENSD